MASCDASMSSPSGPDARPTSPPRDPVPPDGRPEVRPAYPRGIRILLTAFIAYHVLFLLIGNLPGRGLARGLTWIFDRYAQLPRYAAVIGSSQNWAVFAPNPYRANVFLKVLVVDARGRSWDLRHDIQGRRRYPYLFYDRRAKINRRLLRQQGERPLYAAWVCRDWERTHHGQPAREVQFVKTWTRIPAPAEAYRTAGYDPMSLPVEEQPEQTFQCASIVHGQLPDGLRRRYGLSPAAPSPFRDVPARSWWTERRPRADEDRDPGAEEAREDGGTE